MGQVRKADRQEGVAGLSWCLRANVSRQSDARGAIVVKVACLRFGSPGSRRRVSTIVSFYDGSIVQYLMFPFGIWAAKLSSVSFLGSWFRCPFLFVLERIYFRYFVLVDALKVGSAPVPLRVHEGRW